MYIGLSMAAAVGSVVPPPPDDTATPPIKGLLRLLILRHIIYRILDGLEERPSP